MKISGIGPRMIVIGAALALGLAWLTHCAFLALPGVFFAAFSAYFFRDPERSIVRWMTAWDTTPDDVHAFADAIWRIAPKAKRATG